MPPLHPFFNKFQTLICPFQTLYPWAHTNAQFNMYGKVGDNENWVATTEMYFNKVHTLQEKHIRPNIPLLEVLDRLSSRGVTIAITHQIPAALIPSAIQLTHPEYATILKKLTTQERLFQEDYRNGCSSPLAHMMDSLHTHRESTAAIVLDPKDVNAFIRQGIQVCGYTGGDAEKLIPLLKAIPGPVFHNHKDFGLQ